jgi:hypothetical protein
VTALAETAAALREKAADLLAQAGELERLREGSVGRAAYESFYPNASAWELLDDEYHLRWELAFAAGSAQAIKQDALRSSDVRVDRQALAVVLDLVRVHPGQAGVIAACNQVAAALNTPSPSTEGASS